MKEKKMNILNYIAAMALLFITHLSMAVEGDWPKLIEVGDFEITIYQPQFDKYENNELEGRFAFMVENTEEGNQMFGASWYKSVLRTDMDNRVVQLESIDIVETNFPDADSVQVDVFEDVVTRAIEDWDMVIDLDEFLAALERAEVNIAKSEKIKNEAPQVFYRSNPAVLVYIDGTPRFKDTEENNIQYVVNTPYFIVHDVKKDDYYLKGGKFWYMSTDEMNTWKSISSPPYKVEKLAEENVLESEEVDSVALELEKAPEVILSTQPSDLIQTSGTAEFKSIDSTSLLYVENTEDYIFMHIDEQKYFVLLAGRWYQSKLLTSDEWTFIEPTDLPDDFSRIPTSSPVADVLVSVPGTEYAQMALLEQSIPQTAEVDRATATVEVEFDGNPEFNLAKGSKVEYAINSSKTVLRIDGKYYCVDDGIWFVADDATGPYQVSDVRPDEVDDLEPEDPVYNVKYVYVYDSTPDVVVVGYTPGYTYSYVYGGVVVYGSGYYYRPWYGTHYYPHHATWGFHVSYNPYMGWGFSYGMSYGWFSVGYHRPYYGWWGPAGYRYGYHHGYYRGYHHGYNRGYHQGYRNGYRAGYYAGQRNSQGSRNVYAKRQSGIKKTAAINKKASQARPSNRRNDVYSDRRGNVYQDRGNGNFERRTNGAGNRPSNQPSTGQRPSQRPSTQPSTRPNNQLPSTRPSTQPASRPASRPTTSPSTRPSTTPSTRPSTTPSTRPSTRPSTQPNRGSSNYDLQRDSRSRQQGAQRANTYRQSGGYNRPSGGASRPSGGASRPAGGMNRGRR